VNVFPGQHTSNAKKPRKKVHIFFLSTDAGAGFHVQMIKNKGVNPVRLMFDLIYTWALKRAIFLR
jgi:hypothetical protein